MEHLHSNMGCNSSLMIRDSDCYHDLCADHSRRRHPPNRILKNCCWFLEMPKWESEKTLGMGRFESGEKSTHFEEKCRPESRQ